MILLPRRTFLALCALTVAGTAFLLLAIAAQHGRGPLARFARRSSAATLHPAVTGDASGEYLQSLTAYKTIEAALAKGSLAKVPENAARIAEVFGEINPDIAASARRLARLHDVTAARREFQRLTDLFSRRPGDSDDDEADDDEEAPAKRSLEV